MKGHSQRNRIIAASRRRASMTHMCTACLLTAVLACAAYGDPALPGVAEESSRGGGLAVFIDCRDFPQIAELAAGGRWLIHCLYREPETARDARDVWQSGGVYGRVSADVLPTERLPYVGNLVNLLVIGDAAPFGHGGLNPREIARCLAPYGRVYVRTSPGTANTARGLEGVGLMEEDTTDGWQRFVKPYPAQMDAWTHYLHGPDGNAVSQDSTIGVSRSLRWVAGPLWARHHDFAPSLSALVSSEGRIFYIIDEAPPGVAGMPGKWSLVARDAFNGVLLWKRPIGQWGWNHWTNTEVQTFNRQNTPFELTRRLVAAGERLYVTLGYNAPVSQIDARTGEILQTYDETRYTSVILHHQGRLILSVNGGPQRVLAPGEPHGAGKEIVALDPESGRTLWRKGGYAGVTVRADPERNAGTPFLCVGDRQVFLLEEKDIVCLSLEDGTERWRVPRPERRQEPLRSRLYLPAPCAVVHHGRTLYFGQYRHNARAHRDGSLQGQILGMILLAIDADSGEVRWRYEAAGIACTAPPDVFVSQGLVWVFKAGEPTLIGLDASDGEVVKSIPVDDVLKTNHHHRCYGNKATGRYILTAKEGIEYIDVQSGELAPCHWVRGICRYGIMPANGLIYAPPHQCGCFIDAKLNGFLALATDQAQGASVERADAASSDSRLEKGPAYGEDIHHSSFIIHHSSDWPTYRADTRRSGFAGSTLSDKLDRRWEADVGGTLTGVTAAGGRVFLASRDAHTVYCLNAESGEACWRFTAGGRVDTPPTYWQERVLFGSHDGSVYCLRAADGALVWRFRAAPDGLRTVAFGQLESPWPVHGSVLVLDDRVYLTAGRSAHLDSGIYVCCLDVGTGKVLHQRRLSADTSSKGELEGAALSDILVSEGGTIWMRSRPFDARDISRPVEGGTTPPVRATAGLLDDSWFNRTFWVYHGKVPAQYLVFDDETAYGIRAYQKFHWKSFNDAFTPGKEGYQLFAADAETRDADVKAKAKRPRGLSPADTWAVRIPLRAQAMVVAEGVLFAAGVPDVVDPEDPWAAFEGRQGGLLCVFSKTDGKKLAEYRLPAAPVYDGMAASQRRLYVTLKNGRVVCFAATIR